ncbi:hypothetical protein EJ06DRAFT_486966 [Trichodelitschia bisporula]|uniref:MARVEL domain-containing protein n=1 Tax=Trichodelitschia bisporula TaxID=703511 RepID=A0A6G1I7M8_9PEZI|nr:hypothetical protein EJ06DRAFT_486966 [Trichodelitschia bisporula]
MPIPSYGAAPISATFLGIRVMQVTFLVIILGLTGSFINEMVMASHEPSKEIVGALSITAITTLYSLVSISFYWANANLGLFVMAGADFLILIAFIVVSVSIGKPVSYLNCYNRTYAFPGDVLADLQANWNKEGSLLDLRFWSGMSKSNCFETKTIWGFSIALAILFATSSILLPTLHFKNKKAGSYVKSTV